MGFYLTEPMTETAAESRSVAPRSRMNRATRLGPENPIGAPLGDRVLSTKYTDLETGLLYYGYRYYDTLTGRWLSRDPLGENGGRNLYSFAANSPIINYDPQGLANSAVIIDDIVGVIAALLLPEEVTSSIMADIALALFGRTRAINWISAQMNSDGGFAGAVWGRSIALATGSGGGYGPTLEIDENNQGQWGNVIDTIKGTSIYAAEVATLKNSVARGSGITGNVGITYEEPDDLQASLHETQLQYTEQDCKLKLKVVDTYDVHNIIIKELEDDGDKARFGIIIEMPDEDL